MHIRQSRADLNEIIKIRNASICSRLLTGSRRTWRLACPLFLSSARLSPPSLLSNLGTGWSPFLEPPPDVYAAGSWSSSKGPLSRSPFPTPSFITHHPGLFSYISYHCPKLSMLPDYFTQGNVSPRLFLHPPCLNGTTRGRCPATSSA